jgi:hypothetical protein
MGRKREDSTARYGVTFLGARAEGQEIEMITMSGSHESVAAVGSSKCGKRGKMRECMFIQG